MQSVGRPTYGLASILARLDLAIDAEEQAGRQLSAAIKRLVAADLPHERALCLSVRSHARLQELRARRALLAGWLIVERQPQRRLRQRLPR